MSREAMKQALEALEDVPYMSNKDDYERLERVKTALRQALVEPKQKSDPSAWNGWVLREVLFDNGEPIGHRKPEQEPVAEPLYTAPPNREWVGLTDEEVSYCRYAATFCDELDTAYMAELIEKDLKEKNNG